MERRLRGTRVEGTDQNFLILAGSSHNRELFVSRLSSVSSVLLLMILRVICLNVILSMLMLTNI